MAGLVLDASVAMVWGFEDEDVAFADKVLEAVVSGEGASVPSLWAVEVANTILVGERSQRLSEADIARFLGLLEALPIKMDTRTASQALGTTLRLTHI